jgi:hypothetical protein
LLLAILIQTFEASLLVKDFIAAAPGSDPDPGPLAFLIANPGNLTLRMLLSLYPPIV